MAPVMFFELHERLALEAALKFYRDQESGGTLTMNQAIEEVAGRNVNAAVDRNALHDLKSQMGRVLGKRSAAKRQEQARVAEALLGTPADYENNELHRRVIDQADEIRVWVLGEQPNCSDAFFVAVALLAHQRGLPYSEHSQVARVQAWFGSGFAQKRDLRERQRRATVKGWEIAVTKRTRRIDPHSDRAASLFNRAQAALRLEPSMN